MSCGLRRIPRPPPGRMAPMQILADSQAPGFQGESAAKLLVGSRRHARLGAAALFFVPEIGYHDLQDLNAFFAIARISAAYARNSANQCRQRRTLRFFVRSLPPESGRAPADKGRRAGGTRGTGLRSPVALLSRPNELISKADLLRQVWPGLVVEEGSLRFHMTNLRKALGDGSEGHRYIVNSSGRGYSFVAEISRASDQSAARERCGPRFSMPICRSVCR